MWTEPVQIRGEGQDAVTVDITFVLQRELVRGAAVFMVLQLMVLYSLYRSARQLERQRNEGMVNLGQLAAQVAHDIRSPLKALQVVSSSVEFTTSNDAQIGALLNGAIDRIKSISEGLLSEYRAATPAELKISKGPAPAAQAEVDLAKLVSALAEEKKLEWARSGLALELQVKPGLTARIPRLAFLRVLSNLLNNAKEAIEGEGRIAVNASLSARVIVIEVSDTGKGIPADVLRKLGKQRITAGKEGGNGLGMSYVFEQVASWGGSVKVRSKPGKGTTVELKIPKV